MFAKSFHSFGSGISPLDIGPKHPGFVHGIVNSAGSFSGKRGAFINDVTQVWEKGLSVLRCYTVECRNPKAFGFQTEHNGSVVKLFRNPK